MIEVASTSVERDLGAKARFYASFGVREYWVIDADQLVTTVHTGPSPNGSYASVETVDANTVLTPTLVPALTVRLADLDLA